MKFNRKCVNNMCKILGLFMMIPLLISCNKESAYSRLLTQEYPSLYSQVFERDADSLLTFTEHQDEFIRAQAWRALISTPVKVENMDDFITKVQYSNTKEAWMALSGKELSDGQLERLHNLWKERSSLRKGISRVLGKQGNQTSLDVLVQNFDEIIDSENEFESALAIGRLMMDHEISPVTKRSVLRYAAVIEDPKLYRAYFYGLYRSNEAVEDEEILKAIWDGYTWVESPKIRQYILRINSAPEETFQDLPASDITEMNVQLAVELAQQTGKVDWNEKLAEVYRKLLEHQNPVVNETTLGQIEAHSEKDADFDESVIELIVENEEKSAGVRLSGIMALNDPEPYIDLADELASGNEYQLIKRLNILQRVEATESYVSILSDYIESENRMEVLFAAQALQDFWDDLPASRKTNSLSEQVRNLIFQLLDHQDRSITYVTVPFMNESGLISNDDFSRIEDYLAGYRLPDDIEVYQVFGQFLMDRFESASVELLDSLSAFGNVALNSTLRDQGWDIQETKNVPKSFRTPDWQRLGELGANPVWVLETDKGNIEIEMNPISAPATISGMDSLTRAGAYNAVAFHRVVPNFVVQGGDIETGDGFGGPDYVVPTEASSKQYARGIVGIASAGTDTEGSQYFVMHDWAPHLNGRYTIIGEVISGMQVVDKLMVGDKVNQAYWVQVEE